MAPRAARTPLRTAADCPDELACRICRRLARCFHERGKPLGGRVGRAVIDIDDLVGPAAVERGWRSPRSAAPRCRLRCAREQRWKRPPLLGRKKANRRSWFGIGPAAGHRRVGRCGVRFYGAEAPRATLLRRPERGPRQRHDGAVAADRETRAGARRTSSAPTSRRSRRPGRRRPRRSDDAPAAPGGCARSQRHRSTITGRACGHNAETAKASAKAVLAWPDGKLAIGLSAGEMREVEGVSLAADERPAAADDPFETLRQSSAPARRKT